ncbi:MAG TPA: VOC family protein [Thermoanaerobaculia bacterium]|nr:VOC family protein [Thermoanaerobaculia bacterium]
MSEGHPVLGKFVWHDLLTTDLDKSIAFHLDLFGWTIEEWDMGPGGTYKMIHAAGENHGGFAALSPEQTAQGVPPHWMSHCTVADVDAAVARSEKLGGTTQVPATDIPTVGRYAVIADPQGATISLYKPAAWGGEGAAQPAPGTFCWHELLAVDPEEEGKFHAEVFGWKIVPVDMGPMGTYRLFKRDDDKDAGGMLQKPAESGGPSAWLPYVAVENTDDRAQRVPQLGGKVWVQPMDIPNVGRFAVIADPTGAMLGILGPST